MQKLEFRKREKKELEKGKEEYEKGKETIEKEISAAEAEIKKAENDIKAIEEPSWIVLNRKVTIPIWITEVMQKV